MKKIKIKTYEDKVILSLSLTSILPLIKFCGKLDGISPSITSNNIIRNIGGLIPVISRENFTDNKYKTFIRNISIGIGAITSIIVSINTNGKKFFIEFCLNFISSTTGILIIDKLNKLNIIDGLSISILISYFFNIIKMLSGETINVITNLLTCLLFIVIDLQIFKICYSYDKFEYNNYNNYNYALMLCGNIFGKTISILLMPLILFLLNFSSIKNKDIEQIFNSSNMLDKIKPKDNIKKIRNVVLKYSLNMSLIGIIILLFNGLFEIDIIQISLFTGALVKLIDDIKVIISKQKIKNSKIF